MHHVLVELCFEMISQFNIQDGRLPPECLPPSDFVEDAF